MSLYYKIFYSLILVMLYSGCTYIPGSNAVRTGPCKILADKIYSPFGFVKDKEEAMRSLEILYEQCKLSIKYNDDLMYR